MNSKIDSGIEEYKNRNYEKALKNFDSVKRTDKYYPTAMAYKVNCLIELEEYSEALAIVNNMIKNDAYSVVWWFNKVDCHIGLNQDDKALKALHELERVIDSDSAEMNLFIAQFYKRLKDYDNALKYCDKALSIDKNFKEAFFEKSCIYCLLDDNEALSDSANDYKRFEGYSSFGYVTAFLLKLLANDYEGCLEIINENNGDDESIEFLKGILYNSICKDLNVKVCFNEEVNVSVDDCIKLLFDYIKSGNDFGEICGAQYMIF